jgi:archaellum component FlaC
MKYDFWLDLPIALVNISENILSREDKEYIEQLKNTFDKLLASIDNFRKIYESEQIQKLKEEVNALQERVKALGDDFKEVVSRTIKFSSKLMVKLIQGFEKIGKENFVDNNVLVGIKMFLKITRVILEKARLSIN